MKVLVTGATGFTGGHLAQTLAARGDDVRALVRPKSRARFDASKLPRKGVIAAEGDLLDAAAVHRAAEGVDVVYHIAATYREAGQRDSAYRAVNVDGTRHVLEAAKAGGARRVVHCSTGGVHGHIAHPPANEDAPFNPGDVYQETKLEAEQAAREFGNRTGFDVVVARPIGIYGPGDTRFLRMFRGLARRRFPMIGSGQVFYHLTFIDDLVEGFRLCGTVAAAKGRTYLLAGPALHHARTAGRHGGERAEGAAATPALAGVAVLDCRLVVRDGVRAARDRAADLSPPRRLLHQEPRVRHHARANRARLRAAGGPRAGNQVHRRLVSPRGLL